MKGLLVLNGGEAFSSKTKQLDHNWLQFIRQTHRPRLVVVPVAVIDNPRRVADQVMRYFNHLGTFAEYAMLVDSLSANTPSECEILDQVDAVVLTDGSPVDMVERLHGTRTEAALHRTRERKAALVAVGASAMALGAVYWFGGVWEPGLAVMPHLAVIPHHQIVRMRLSPEKLMAGLPEDVMLAGIDDMTAAICYPDGTVQVKGQGQVTVYRSSETQESFRAGQTFELSI
ncbi:MAG: Type 1 glutamine amidotransferase-like domain-containing protein [Anaerolineae bacterium]|nr:Type 1 glutamine amidotransferase-like domain-containing protein [Anaerolineae bacterium]